MQNLEVNKNFSDEIQTDDEECQDATPNNTTAVGNVSFARSVSFTTNKSRTSKGSGVTSRVSLTSQNANRGTGKYNQNYANVFG